MVTVIQSTYKSDLVTTVTSIFSHKEVIITSMNEYKDVASNIYLLRIESGEYIPYKKLEKELRKVLPEGAIIKINPRPEKKVVILVTKEYHCLADILIRNEFKTLGASIQCVIGNYPVLEGICKRFGIPFHYVSHEEKDKPSFEADMLEVINKYQADYLVLAKFMRILSPDFFNKFPMRIINIHHSFLPAFAGANPYRQAYQRGVKLIGATAHFVTPDLDEGPIITQQTAPVNHAYSAADMIKTGREIETSVLSRALQLVFNDRVFIFDNKTFVFE
ncbi:MAG: formyltetrahydrofolate deformylase [Chitinophagaceae bacterium]